MPSKRRRFNLTAFSTVSGASPGGGDVDRDGQDDLLAGAGPDPAAGAAMKAYSYDLSTLTPLPGVDGFSGSRHGVNVGSGHFDH